MNEKPRKFTAPSKKMSYTFPSVIGLNVGGKIFATRLSTLIKYPDSMLGAMFSGRHNLDTDRDGNYFIDRNGKYFEHILDFLRNDQYLPPRNLTEAVLSEAVYYGLNAFVEILKKTPALFPQYYLREEQRRAVVHYDRIKEKVIDIAMKGAMTKVEIPTTIGYYTKHTTTVYIRYYTSVEATVSDTKSIKTVFSFEEALLLLDGQNKAEYSVCLNEDDAKDFRGFIAVLLYDLFQAGYQLNFSIYDGKENPPFCNSFIPVFNGKTFRLTQCCILTFSWQS